MHKSILSAALIAMMMVPVQSTATLAADWDMVGAWKLTVKCPKFQQVNNVTVGRADLSKIVGTTNVGDVYGKITAGKFDGEDFIFTNKYKFRGGNFTETWQGKLASGGRSMRGIMDSSDPGVGRCTYRGSRV